MMVHARAQVFMGCLARFSFSLETFRKSFSFTNGPFFALLLIVVYPNRLNIHGLRTLLEPAELAATEDQFFGVLSRIPRDAALGGHAGLAHGMAAAIGSTFAAAQ